MLNYKNKILNNHGFDSQGKQELIKCKKNKKTTNLNAMQVALDKSVC